MIREASGLYSEREYISRRSWNYNPTSEELMSNAASNPPMESLGAVQHAVIHGVLRPIRRSFSFTLKTSECSPGVDQCCMFECQSLGNRCLIMQDLICQQTHFTRISVRGNTSNSYSCHARTAVELVLRAIHFLVDHRRLRSFLRERPALSEDLCGQLKRQ